MKSYDQVSYGKITRTIGCVWIHVNWEILLPYVLWFSNAKILPNVPAGSQVLEISMPTKGKHYNWNYWQIFLIQKALGTVQLPQSNSTKLTHTTILTLRNENHQQKHRNRYRNHGASSGNFKRSKTSHSVSNEDWNPTLTLIYNFQSCLFIRYYVIWGDFLFV